MKKIAFAAMALAALVGFMGCDTGSNGETDDPAVTYSSWWIKGSFDSWSDSPKHYFIVDEIDANKLTFEITGLYKHSTIPIVYQFVLVNPEGVEYKIEGASGAVTSVTPGTAFTLGDSAATGSTTLANAGFEAAMSSYTVTVDITTATAPSVNLVAGSAAAPEVTNEVLIEKLAIKGNQFSAINGTAVDAWTATAGTAGATTMAWDVLVDNKNGEFGFNSIDGFLKDATIDVSALTEGGAASAADVLSNSTGSNCKLTGMPKAGAVYTLTVTVDTTKTVAEGRYSLTAALKTASTTDWAFEIPAEIYITGSVTGDWSEADDDVLRPALAVASNQATYAFTADATGKEIFKISLTADSGWDGLIGFGGVVTTGTTVAIYDDWGNIAFDAVSGTEYTITVDFSGDYTATGKPLVTIE